MPELDAALRFDSGKQNRVGSDWLTDELTSIVGLSKQFALNPETTGGATLGYFGGNVPGDGTTPVTVAGGTATLTLGTTMAPQANFVEIDLATGTITVATDDWTAGLRKLYYLETDESGVIEGSVVDWRSPFQPRDGGDADTLDGHDSPYFATAAATAAAQAAANAAQSDVDAHEALTNNPHSVTQTQVGLSNVDNTSDATKNAAAVTLTNKTLTTPTIASLTNAQHSHLNAAGGGVITSAAISDFTAAVQAQLNTLDVKTGYQYATATALPANTYSNGSSGVGATLTGTANGPLSVDSILLTAGAKMLVKNEADATHNGWWVLTQQGVALVSPYILTRATDADQAAEMGPGFLTPIEGPTGSLGTLNNGTLWISLAPSPFVVGTSSITFAQEDASGAALKANNLSDLASASTARTNLGLAALAVLATVGTAQIDNDAVTYAKIQNVSATDKLLGRSTAGAGDVEEIALTAAGRALIDDADAAAQRATLSLDNVTNVAQEAAANKDASGGYVGLSVWKIKFRNAANTFTSFLVNAATAARTYTFQDRDGTIADDTDLALKAPLASPALSGTPTVPTAAADTNTTQAASTAFVLAQAASATPIVDGTGAVGTSTRYARADHVHPIVGLPTQIGIAVSDETTSLTTGTAKVTFRMPFAMTLTAVRASLTTASSSGIPAIDVNEAGVSIFSTTLTIDASELTSTTAATPAVISDANLADDAQITVDIDTAGTGAKGLKIWLIGTRA